MKKFKKLSYFTDAVRTSEKDCQEENFILGLVKFFDNFNFYYKFITMIEEEYGVTCHILPSFNHKSEDEKVSSFKFIRLKLDRNDIYNSIIQNYTEIQYKDSTFGLKFFLEETTENSVTIQIELI